MVSNEPKTKSTKIIEKFSIGQFYKIQHIGLVYCGIHISKYDSLTSIGRKGEKEERRKREKVHWDTFEGNCP